MTDEAKLVEMVHGDGGRATRDLIDSVFIPALAGNSLSAADDAAALPQVPGSWMITTDAFVVSPAEFPGGDVGELAVYGTINDLAACGARPVYMTASFILQEGLDLDALRRVVTSMGHAAATEGVELVAADTKVVERGSADGVFISATGLGCRTHNVRLAPDRISAGDRVIVTGYVGDHGLAVLANREGFPFSPPAQSDCAPLWGVVRDVLQQVGDAVKFLRDPTRGGLATALKEMITSLPVDVMLREGDIPVRRTVREAADMLGLDPLYLANEGNMLMVVSEDAAGEVLKVLRCHDTAAAPSIVGEVTPGTAAVRVRTALGGTRNVGFFAGDPLPRIC